MANHPHRSRATPIRDLDELLSFLRTNPTADDGRARAIPVNHGECDWTSLPTFGGNEPADTVEVWSWDADRLIVGKCYSDIRIVPRF
jgi:hypothetical protein